MIYDISSVKKYTYKKIRTGGMHCKGKEEEMRFIYSKKKRENKYDLD